MQIGDYGVLRVVSCENVGTFLDWGQPKDLFLPHAERIYDLQPGDDIVAYTYTDKSDRVSASMRLERNKARTNDGLTPGQQVDLIIADETDLGFKAVINDRALGMLYHNEIFQKLEYCQKLKGYIKEIRSDQKVDLILQAPGHRAAVDDIAPKILELLEKNRGFYAINDKTSAEEIYRLFGVSKNKYKIALGGLYKARKILVEKDGTRLVPAKS